jgi:hypothetical protein
MTHWHLIDIDDASIPACLNSTMLLNSLEDALAKFPIPDVAGQPPGKEQ